MHIFTKQKWRLGFFLLLSLGLGHSRQVAAAVASPAEEDEEVQGEVDQSAEAEDAVDAPIPVVKKPGAKSKTPAPLKNPNSKGTGKKVWGIIMIPAGPIVGIYFGLIWALINPCPAGVTFAFVSGSAITAAGIVGGIALIGRSRTDRAKWQEWEDAYRNQGGEVQPGATVAWTILPNHAGTAAPALSLNYAF